MGGLKQWILLGVFAFGMGCGSSVEVVAEVTPEETTVEVAIAEAAPEEAQEQGDAHDHADHGGEAHSCTCAAGHDGGTVWCDQCEKGYVDGEATADKAAVDAALAES